MSKHHPDDDEVAVTTTGPGVSALPPGAVGWTSDELEELEDAGALEPPPGVDVYVIVHDCGLNGAAVGELVYATEEEAEADLEDEARGYWSVTGYGGSTVEPLTLPFTTLAALGLIVDDELDDLEAELDEEAGR